MSFIQTISPLIGQLESITPNDTQGWVLGSMTALAGTLFFFQLREIKQMLSELLKTVSSHDTRIAVLEHQVEDIEEQKP